MEAWLYDEFPYPSGAAGGALLARHPEMAERHLTVIRIPLIKGQKSAVIAALEGNRIVEAFAVRRDAEGGMALHKRETDEVGVVGTAWFRTEWDSRYYYDSKYANLHDCPRSGCYQPHWAWEKRDAEPWDELIVFVEHRAKLHRAFGEYVDVSSRETAEAFIALTHAAYKKRLEPYFGSVIPGIFTDEPKYHHRLPWSARIASQWADYASDPEALLALAEDIPGGDARRRAFRSVYAELFKDNWTGSQSDWCQKNGLAFCGHISPEEDWLAEASCLGSILKNLRAFHIPGCDLIIPAVGDRDHPILNLIPSLACSAAAQEGRDFALCEIFGCNDYGQTVQDMKRISDWMTLFGINFFVPHCLFYSIDGDRKYDAPPTFCAPSTLQPYFGYWADAARLSAGDLGPANVVADVLIIRPMNRLSSALDIQCPENQKIYQRGMALAGRLLDRGLMFHWLDDDETPDLQAKDGRAVYRKASYGHVIYLDGTLADPFLSRLEGLRLLGVDVLTEAELETLPCPLKKATGMVRVTSSRSGQWFAVNPGPERVEFVIEDMAHALEGYESRWLRDAAPATGSGPMEVPDVLNDWQVEAPRENCLVLKHWKIDGQSAELGAFYKLRPHEAGNFVKSTLGPIPANPKLKEPVKVRYQSVFHLASPLRLRLVVEEGAMEGSWEGFLNGRPLAHWKNATTYDRFNLECDLGQVAPGRQELSFEFTLERSHEGMLDICRVFGDFQIRDAFAAEPKLTPPGSVAIDATDWAASGYPFYSGEVAFETTFDWAESGDRVFCRATAPLCDQAMVWLNGTLVGPLAWSPWEIELTEFLLPGANSLRLCVSNSLANMIYGNPRRSGFGDARIQLHRLAAGKRPSIGGKRQSTLVP